MTSHRYVVAMRAYVAGVQHESSTFSPIPTPLEHFGRGALQGPPDGKYQPGDGDDMGYGAFARIAPGFGIEVVCGPWSNVQPSRPASANTWAVVRDAIVSGLVGTGPVDLVFLMLHGAQSAEGVDDCEGELVELVRACAPSAVVAVLLDLHANITDAMVTSCDLLVACRQYPHTDYADRVAEMVPQMLAISAGAVRPLTAAVRVPASGVFPTAVEPMRSLIEHAREIEVSDGVMSVSLVHGFEGADSPDAGACVLVTVERDPDLANRLAWSLANEMLLTISSHQWLGPGIDESLELAWKASEGPVVMADRGDNAGGGAASDSTWLLGPLLDRARHSPLPGAVAVALVWDPVAVQFCHAVGEGALIDLRLGGKAGPASGPPLDVTARVSALRRDVRQALFGQGEPAESLGDSAAIVVDGVDIVLNSRRQQVFSHHVFTGHGIDPRSRRLLVVKSTQHFMGGFGGLASSVIRCESPGTTSNDLATFPYRRLRRPMFPLDQGVDLFVEWIHRAVAG